MITKRIENFLTARETLRNELKARFVDMSLDLEDRWQLFIDARDVLDDSHGGYDSLTEVLGMDSLYDNGYERYSRNYFADIDEQLVQDFDDMAENPDGYGVEHKLYEANYDKWREAVLAEGYASFTYDW